MQVLFLLEQGIFGHGASCCSESLIRLMLSSLAVRSCCLSFFFGYAYLCVTLSRRDEMLLHGMSLGFVRVSHKLKLTSLGSHLGAGVHYSFTVYVHRYVFSGYLILGPLAQSRCGL